MASDKTDKTAMIVMDQDTINRELQRAKDSPACFVLIRGNPIGHRFLIEKDEMFIGRDPSADIYIADPLISRKHAKVTREGTVIKIEDLGSSNGTGINGKNLTAGNVSKLAKEDVVKLGNSFVKFIPAGEMETIFLGAMNQEKDIDKIYSNRKKWRSSLWCSNLYRVPRLNGFPYICIFWRTCSPRGWRPCPAS